MSNCPAEIGMTLDQIQTPALIVDLAAMEENIAILAKRVAENKAGVRLMPHAKTHKCVEIAQLQIAAGAKGVCCQNVAEAEAMVAGGIKRVLLSNEIVGADKSERLARLARSASIAVCVDHESQVDMLSAAATSQSSTLDVLVEIDVGAGRCGVPPGERAVALAKYVASKSGLRFAGLQAYHGPAQHFRKPEERTAAITKAAQLTRDTVALFKAAGLACEVIAGAGTGSFENELASGVYNELQCGSYVFMDVDYGRNQTDKPFANALFILTTVISAAAPGRAVCDAGLKASSVDSGLPAVHGRPAVVYAKISDEHGTLEISGEGRVTVGDRLKLIPGHCDPTVNLHDWLIACRDGKVEAVWKVARGW
ncbi:alanine racemase [Afipia sp. Root123D2]|uniref:DSD1 family PLP-dependent enzyme n=1 Tax=Afipia sp. Root123D2 TaxID=1736436 RepID=UPI0007019360|nr:DSD1 family PLP-dependent enzyme [Afipia sp. Root123D2]KQW18387.1 alanine racemase [Afipia sp. Root123D2]